jgi:hypothetical protein
MFPALQASSQQAAMSRHKHKHTSTAAAESAESHATHATHATRVNNNKQAGVQHARFPGRVKWTSSIRGRHCVRSTTHYPAVADYEEAGPWS